MADFTPKEPPTTEKSLNQISWHLKTLVEEFKALNMAIKMLGAKPKFSKNDDDVNF